MYLGQEEVDPITEALSLLAKKASPALTEQASALGTVVAAKVQPMVRDELNRQIPKIAIIAGLTFGVFFIVGVTSGLITTKKRG